MPKIKIPLSDQILTNKNRVQTFCFFSEIEHYFSPTELILEVPYNRKDLICPVFCEKMLYFFLKTKQAPFLLGTNPLKIFKTQNIYYFNIPHNYIPDLYNYLKSLNLTPVPKGDRTYTIQDLNKKTLIKTTLSLARIKNFLTTGKESRISKKKAQGYFIPFENNPLLKTLGYKFKNNLVWVGHNRSDIFTAQDIKRELFWVNYLKNPVQIKKTNIPLEGDTKLLENLTQIREAFFKKNFKETPIKKFMPHFQNKNRLYYEPDIKTAFFLSTFQNKKYNKFFSWSLCENGQLQIYTIDYTRPTNLHLSLALKLKITTGFFHKESISLH
jgi:hypothetical protein